MRLAIILLISLANALASPTQKFIPQKIEGPVVEVLIGELNPFVGDYCVVIIKDVESEKLYGLVSDEGPSGPLCDDAETIERGWMVGAYKPNLASLKSSDLIGALKEYANIVLKNKEVFFLKYDAGLSFLGESF